MTVKPYNLNDIPMRPYQDAAYEFCVRHPKCGLFMDMGLGKTRIAGARIADMIYQFWGTTALILGTKRVVEEAWPEELEKWRYTRDLKYVVLKGSAKQIQELLKTPNVDIFLCSYSLAHHLVQRTGQIRPDMIIFDESQKLRNQKTKRHQAALLLSARCKYIMELTGTPVPNGMHQLYGQIKLLDGGVRLGTTETAFLKRWFTVNPYSGKPELGKGSFDDISKTIRGICFTLLTEDYVDLPPLVINDVIVTMDDKLAKQYAEFEEEQVMQLPETGDKITALTAAALYAKLSQFANGEIYDNDKKNKKSHIVHDLKMEALDDIIDEAFGENVLVIYQQKCDRDRILAKYPQARHIHSNEDVRAWKRGEISIGLAHPQSLGEGLNLQSGGRIMVWYGITFNLENYLQMVKRLWRSGQTKPVIMHRIFCKGTVDTDMRSAINRKNATQYDFMVAMKHRVELHTMKRAA